MGQHPQQHGPGQWHWDYRTSTSHDHFATCSHYDACHDYDACHHVATCHDYSGFWIVRWCCCLELFGLSFFLLLLGAFLLIGGSRLLTTVVSKRLMAASSGPRSGGLKPIHLEELVSCQILNQHRQCSMFRYGIAGVWVKGVAC
jgi:hypothetical protein